MKRNPIDALLDLESNENVFIKNESGQEMELTQICVLTLDEDTYAILQPVRLLKGMEENDALVFEIIVDEDTNDSSVEIVTDEDVIDEVFDAYEELLEEEE